MTFVEFLEMLRDRVIHRSQLGKRKLDAALVRRELDRSWMELGERLSELVKHGRVAAPEDLKVLLARVGELERKLADCETEVARLRRESASET